jgi:hypothetical protein
MRRQDRRGLLSQTYYILLRLHGGGNQFYASSFEDLIFNRKIGIRWIQIIDFHWRTGLKRELDRFAAIRETAPSPVRHAAFFSNSRR